MQIAIIGLGRMGANIARRLMRHGHECVVYDQDPAPGQTLAKEGAKPAASLKDVVSMLKAPRAVWLMLPAGEITEQSVAAMGDLLQAGDVVIDGGNTFWKDDIRRADALAEKGIHYLDIGTSGGVWGLERGYCLMIGGPEGPVRRLDPIFKALAPGVGTNGKTPRGDDKDPRPEQGYLHAGSSGAGHFVKMIHNGIEYGLMQAYAEGFDILKNANSAGLPEKLRLKLDVADIAEVWRRGSVVSSWLLDLIAISLAEDDKLEGYSGHVQDSGEGRWTVMTAVEESVSANVLTAALYARFRSRDDSNFSDRLLSAMRKQFGGHVETK